MLKTDEPGLKNKFRELIATIGVIAGVKEDPDQLTLSLLWEYLTTYATGFTLSDIRTAAMMNAAGEFDPKVQHYGLLDVNFISGIMEVYLEKKIQVRKLLPQLLKPAPEYVESEKESYDGLIAFVKKTGEFPLAWSWQKVYDYMMDIGLIRETKDERWNLYNQEMEHLSDSIASDATQISFIESRSRREKLPELAKMNCIKKLIQKHLPK